MYADLADAVEHFKDLGFIKSFQIKNGNIYCDETDTEFSPGEVKIFESYRHERMTDPGTDETVYAIESLSGTKGILVAAYGMYVEHDKAEIIDKLLNSQEKIQ